MHVKPVCKFLCLKVEETSKTFELIAILAPPKKPAWVVLLYRLLSTSSITEIESVHNLFFPSNMLLFRLSNTSVVFLVKSKPVLGLFVTIQTVALLYIQVHAYPCHDWIILNNSVLPIRHTVRILLPKVNNCSLSVSKSLIKKKTSIAEKTLTPTLTTLCIAFCNLTYSIPLSKDLKKRRQVGQVLPI